MPFAFVPKRPLIALAGAAFLFSGCSAIVEQRGYVADPDKMAAIRSEADTKESVLAALGTPSTVSPFDDSVWYYMSSTTERYAFQNPHVTKRDIVAIHFDKSDRVSKIERYDMKDGRDVAVVDRKTPTKGKELTFMQQMFGNFGRIGPDRRNEASKPTHMPGGR